MKNTSIFVGISLLLLNILCALVFTDYSTVTCLLSSTAIAVTTGFIVLARSITMKDGFFITLFFVYIMCGAASFTMGLFSHQTFENNPCIIIETVIIIVQGVLTYIFHLLSKK